MALAVAGCPASQQATVDSWHMVLHISPNGGKSHSCRRKPRADRGLCHYKTKLLVCRSAPIYRRESQRLPCNDVGRSNRRLRSSAYLYICKSPSTTT